MELLYHPTLFSYQPKSKPSLEIQRFANVGRNKVVWKVGLINYSAVPTVIVGTQLSVVEVLSSGGDASKQPWSMPIVLPNYAIYRLDYAHEDLLLEPAPVVMPNQR